MTFRWLRSGNKEKPTSEWSTKDVQRFFREQDLEEVAVAAKKAKLGSKQLLRHEPGELYATLGVTRLAQKKKLRSALIHLRQQSLAEELAVSLTSSSSSSSSPPPSSSSSSSSFSASSSPSSSFSFLPTASKPAKAVFSQSDTTITKVSSSTWSPVVPSRRVRSGSGSSFGTPCASGESTPSSYHTPQSSPPSTPVRLRSLSDAADLAQRLDDVTNLSEAFAFLHRNSVITVKAALRRRAIDNSKSVVAYDEVDVSLLRLGVGGGSRQLRYADLVEEVARVHGSVAARRVKIRYTDGEGDEVTILGDDALRYAFRDWRQRVQATPPGRLAPSWRLCLYLDEADEEDEGHHHTKTCK